jgi:hypothetical protein
MGFQAVFELETGLLFPLDGSDVRVFGAVVEIVWF